jgi:serine/threonine-protein kinase
MTDDQRVQQLLDRLNDSDATPEEVCRFCPELLPVVRHRWQTIRHLRADLDVLFPPSSQNITNSPAVPADGLTIPQIPGHEVETVLGRGGMGIVFRARHVRLNRPVAIKMLLAGAYAQPTERERFRREAEAVASLRHPNVVQVYDVGEVDGHPYFTMEYVDGGSLAQKLTGTPPPARAAAELLTTLAAAVHAAHVAGIVHRDLKPGNVLLAADGTPKVGDFGLARRLDGDSDLTRTGVAVGTPSYMAPEQVDGKTDAVGPATDVHALGSILYELLTGRPPFKGETSEETLRQVVSQDPVAPSKLNPRVPRDLETVCLKSLHKSPARRYASARELADDLGRFLEGKPVRARPVGIGERTVKWARRRPTVAVLVVALFALSAVAAGTGIWLRHQEADRRADKEKREGQARADLEAALGRADGLGQEERWQEALNVLAGVSTQVAEANSPDLEQRLGEAQSGFRIAQRLEGVRDSTARGEGEQRVEYQRWAANYKVAFQEAGLNIDDDPEAVADFIRRSAIRDPLVAAIEDRALVAFVLNDEKLTDRLLTIARLSDRAYPWVSRLHDPTVWRDPGRLKELAATANAASPAPTAHQLGLLGLLLRQANEYTQSTQILGDACRRRPGSFWLNHETGFALWIEKRNVESAAYYRNALNLRPGDADVCGRLAEVLLNAGQTDEALAASRHAVKLSPALEHRESLVRALASTGYWKDAEVECQRALEIDPTFYAPYTSLAMLLMSHKRYEDSAKMFRRVYEIDPNAVPSYDFLGSVLADLGRHEEAIAAYRRLMKNEPENTVLPMYLAKSLVALGRKKEALAELRAAIARKPANDWIIPQLHRLLRTEGQTDEAIRTFRKAVTVEPRSFVAWDGLIDALLDEGRFSEAREAIQTRLKLRATDADRRAQRRQLEICNLLLAVEAKLPAILDGKEDPIEVPTKLAIAEWCLKYKRFTMAAARVYASVLSTQPPPADLITAHRFDAACAAALAGCGVGGDAATLDERRRVEVRKQALEWLTAEYDAWAERHRAARLGDRTLAARTLRTWSTCDELKEVRDEQALTKLPAEEERAWKALWEKVGALATKDPDALFAQARAHAGRCEWDKAAASYAAGIEVEPTDNGDLWFEYAACQLLAGDRPGYRRSCAQMLARCEAAPSMRSYLAARASTLAPDSTDDPTLPNYASHKELIDNSHTVWATTEIAALSLRGADPDFPGANPDLAIPGFEKSLRADRRPGRAVVSWLWLTLAHQEKGESEEAQRCFARATNWLDQQTGKAPVETAEMGSHLHNWLEAQVLRKEIEARFR